jgi:(p)ppGpp synthase/HD superfamily hydrolase
MHTIESVTRIAHEAHLGQMDKTGLPYVYHPIRVAANLRAKGASIELVFAGLLHDTLEDSDLTADDLRTMYIPERTVYLVERVTRIKDDGQTYHEWVEGMVDDPEVATLKYEDSMDNLMRGTSLVTINPKKAASLRKKYERATNTLFPHTIYATGNWRILSNGEWRLNEG